MSFASLSAYASFSAYEDDRDKPALGTDPTLALVKGGVEPVSVTSGIFEASIVEKLRDAQRQVIVTSSGGRCIQVILFVLCAVCGSLLPLVQDWTKVYPATYLDIDGNEIACEGRTASEIECKGGLPYLPGTAVVVDTFTSLAVGFLLTASLSGWEGLRQCCSPARLRMTAPIAIFYVTGDIVQFMAIGATNAAFFLVVGQTKLIATALIAMCVLKTQQSTAQWFLLGAVTVTCGLYCDLELLFIHQKDRGRMEAYGLLLSLTKVGLAAVNAVFTERAFKASGSEPIWVNQVFNNFIIGLVYKKVNAVVKYLAYAQSLWITYLVNMLLLGVAFNVDLFLVILLLVLLVIAYSFAKVDPHPVPMYASEGFSRGVTPGIISPVMSPSLQPSVAPAFPRGTGLGPAMSPTLCPNFSLGEAMRSPVLGPGNSPERARPLSPVLSFSSFETVSRPKSGLSKEGKDSPPQCAIIE